MRRGLVLLLSFILSDCATAAQQQAEQIGVTFQAIRKPTDACLQKITGDPEFAPLAVHFPIGNGSQPTIEQMADTSMPTPQDVQLISKYYSRAEACLSPVADGLATVAPSLSQVVSDFISRTESNALALARGQESWGEFVTNKRQLQFEQRQKLAEAIATLKRELNAEDQEERERRQQAFEAAAQYFQNQQLINSLNQPRVTNCTQFDMTTTCRSY